MATLVKNGYLGALGGGSGVSLVRRLSNLTRSILSTFSGSLYLPSPTSCFTDVAGTTPCAVDTTVGLMLDEMRTLGSELVTNGDFSAGTTGWTGALGGVLSSASGALTVTQGLASYGQARQTLACVVGATYKYTWEAISGTASSFVIQIDGATKATTAGSGGVYFVATSTTPQVVLAHNNTNAIGTTLLFDNISVREVTGIHATQATAGYRPTLRGKVKNLAFPSSGASLITPTRATYIDDGTTINITGTPEVFYKLKEDSTATSTHFGQPSAKLLLASLAYTASYYVKAGGRTKFRLDALSAANWSPASPSVTYDLSAVTATGANGATGTITEVSSGIFKITWTATTSATAPTSAAYPVMLDATGSATYNGDGISGIYITGYQLELGTVANPYVATGATVASSSYGPYYEEFDGLVTRQTLSSVPFQMSDDFFVVVGATNLSTAAVGTIFSIANTGSANPMIRLSYNITTGAPVLFMRDDAGVSLGITGATGIPAGTPNVLAITRISGVTKVFVNGVQVGTSSTALGAATFNVATIGALTYTSTTGFFNGKLNYLDYGIGAISDAQLLTTMRLAGQKTGVTI